MQNYKNFNDESILEFEVFNDYPLTSIFTTRYGGVSEGQFSSLNLWFMKGDDKENVKENYRILAKKINVDVNKIVVSHQKHNANILVVEEEHIGMGLTRTKNYEDIDGLYTELKEVPIVSIHADCAPIYFYDKKREAIALAHSGWRGTKQTIAEKMIKLFVERGSNPSDIICLIGPTVCTDCYEVSQEVLDAMEEALSITNNGLGVNDEFPDYYFIHKETGKPHVSMREINRRLLIDGGVKTDNIMISDYCTKCRPDLFFSHRISGFDRGCNAACMCMR